MFSNKNKNNAKINVDTNLKNSSIVQIKSPLNLGSNPNVRTNSETTKYSAIVVTRTTKVTQTSTILNRYLEKTEVDRSKSQNKDWFLNGTQSKQTANSSNTTKNSAYDKQAEHFDKLIQRTLIKPEIDRSKVSKPKNLEGWFGKNGQALNTPSKPKPINTKYEFQAPNYSNAFKNYPFKAEQSTSKHLQRPIEPEKVARKVQFPINDAKATKAKLHQLPNANTSQSGSKLFNKPVSLNSKNNILSSKSTPPKQLITYPQLQQPISIALQEMCTPVNIKVKKTYKTYDSNSKVPTYQTHGSKRGCALVINNIDFANNVEKSRKGAIVDEKNISELLEALNIKPLVRRNLKSTEMHRSLKEVSTQSKLKSVDLCVVVIMSHGHGDSHGNTSVVGTDGVQINVSSIISYFSDANCKALQGKPKIFIFQNCRGSDRIEMETDATRFNPQVHKDMLLAFATIPGFVSYRNPKFGSFYIQAICKIFMEHACDTHVQDMLIMVGHELDKIKEYRQISSYENLGFKNCYLHPA